MCTPRGPERGVTSWHWQWDDEDGGEPIERIRVPWSDRIVLVGLLMFVIAAGIYVFPIAEAAKAAAVALFATAG